ncbi:WYL domain-containing protein [Rhizobium paknamense]|uniref:Tellurite resistance protein B-like protein n=1 Tax=Rhizobium paknamense TaxID=1206817 RepID=A0ABU0IEA9_9HYPH|nr:WYL domain-containing protein [Rhizobium paknamense]MDQ0456022.1 putative tellurite resistance protein B-like protein [Rhizobium paknamense]
MAISDFLTVMSEHVEARPYRAAKPIILPETDDDDLADVSDVLGYAEGQSFMIEYVDSRGRGSARRVTVWSIVAGAGGTPCLFAKCHERNAMRQFRIDRIKCCIDYDGEVFEDVPLFLRENFGMSLPASLAAGLDKDWARILEDVRVHAVLIAAVMRSDGRVHEQEVEIGLIHLIAVAERSGHFLDELRQASLQRYLLRLRPTDSAIKSAIDSLIGEDKRQIERLLRVCVAVMDADGKRDVREKAAINALADEILGVVVV